MNEPTKFAKNDEVWAISIDDYQGLTEQPVIRHGVCVGGGDSVTIIRWDNSSSNQPERYEARTAIRRFARTKDEVIAKAMALLEARRTSAERDVARANQQLAYLNALIGAEPR